MAGRHKKNALEKSAEEIAALTPVEFNQVVRRLRFGSVATEDEVRAVFRKGLSLAAGTKSSSEYATVMRTLLMFMKFERELELSDKLIKENQAASGSEQEIETEPIVDRNPLAGLKVVG